MHRIEIAIDPAGQIFVGNRLGVSRRGLVTPQFFTAAFASLQMIGPLEQGLGGERPLPIRRQFVACKMTHCVHASFLSRMKIAADYYLRRISRPARRLSTCRARPGEG